VSEPNQPRRVVVKLGTRTLTRPDGHVALARWSAILEGLVDAHRRGVEVLVVSSGAVGLGAVRLGLAEVPRELVERQACAAVGQSRLMGLWEQGFSRFGLVAAQVLLTQGDFDQRPSFLNLRSTLLALLRRRVVPVINENDAVATEELAFVEGSARPVFGDNDRLSALVAAGLDADLLVLLTDVGGVYTRDPREDPGAVLMTRLEDPEAQLAAIAAAPGSSVSRGGMRSKVEAAAIASRAGCAAVIASGDEPQVIRRVLAGEPVGTLIPPRRELGARQRWIAWGAAPRGVLHLDAGAVLALRERGASLLAAGVARVEGEFEAGAAVELRDPAGRLVGRGLVSCNGAVARSWCAGDRPAGVRNHRALVHRDHLVLERAEVPAQNTAAETAQ
jgi:glutamate 5-kinase